MIDFLSQYGLFLLKTVTLVIAILFCMSGIVSILRDKSFQKGQIEVYKLNEKYKEIAKILKNETFSRNELKKDAKIEKEKKKALKKKEKEDSDAYKRKMFILRFDGDIRASEVADLREEITAILMVANAEDEVLLILESSGGLVHTYGLAASQLQRIKTRKIPLTVVVDKVAASGGYLMASIADKIIAAPFAVIGSIGVLAQIPNFNRFLKKKDIDFEQITAGEFKRTLTVFGENTDNAREKLKEELEETHSLFKSYITQNRTSVDIDNVSTGEHWYGTRALELNLVDEIMTSDEYLNKASAKFGLFEINYTAKKPLRERVFAAVRAFLNGNPFSWWQYSDRGKYI